MNRRPLPSSVNFLLEYGPIIGFVVAYVIYRNDTVSFAGTDYTGLVLVTAGFIPVVIIAIGLLWLLSGKLSRIQVATALMVVIFGGLSVWLNDPRLFKMKPTAIYLALALFLLIGLLRGQLWVQYIMQDMLPMEAEGWMILTRRMLVLFVLSAGANELVWRTQSEGAWVFFETVVMPLVVIGFFIAQIGVFVEFASVSPTKPSKKKRRSRGSK